MNQPDVRDAEFPGSSAGRAGPCDLGHRGASLIGKWLSRRQESDRILALLCGLMLGGVFGSGSIGCRRTTPVDEIRVSESKVDLTSQPLELAATDWPCWRGPSGDGLAPDQAAPVTWSETENVRWMSEVPGRGHSAPIVVGGTVFLATADRAAGIQSVLAFDRHSGDRRWSKTVHQGKLPPSASIHVKSSDANGTLCSDGERLFTAFLNDDRVMASALTVEGELIWQVELGRFDSKFGYAPSPVLYESTVIFAADNQGGGYLAALDRVSGEIRWRIARPAIATYSSPKVSRFGGRDQLVISGCDVVTSYDPATGERLWSTPGTAEATCGTVVFSQQAVFASGGYPDSQTVAIDPSGEVLWTNRVKVYEPSMLVTGESLFAVTDAGIAYCWDAATGRTRWRERIGGSFSASPVLCDGNLYVPNLGGVTVVFKADPAGYTEVAKNRLGNDSYASPAFSRGEIFMRVGFGQGEERREKLVCIGRPAAGSDASR